MADDADHMVLSSLYGLQFHYPSPMCREAVSRTTRYRILKKRKTDASAAVIPQAVSADLPQPSTTVVSHTANDEEPEHELAVACSPTANHVADTLSNRDNISCVDHGLMDSGLSGLAAQAEGDLTVSEELRDASVNSDVLNELLPPENNNPALILPLDEDQEFRSHELADETENEDTSFVPTISPISLLAKQYSIRHNLSQEALSDLLQLLRLNCRSTESDIPPAPSLFLFEKQFSYLQHPLTFQYMCSDCFQPLPTSKVSHCPNRCCKKDFTSVGAVSSFIEIPLQPQLRNIFKRELKNNTFRSWIINRKSQLGGVLADLYLRC